MSPLLLLLVLLRFTQLGRDGRRGAEAPHGKGLLLVVDEDDHPDADCAGGAEQGGTVYPSRPTLFTVFAVKVGSGRGEPSDLRGDAARVVAECFGDRIAYPLAAANAIEES